MSSAGNASRAATETDPVRKPGVIHDPAKRLGAWVDRLIGLASMILGLSVLAVVPVANLLSLGYMVEASGRVARSGKLSDGFVGLRKASRLGQILGGIWLVTLPLRLMASLASEAAIAAPSSPKAGNWHLAYLAVATLTAFHILWACLRGGRISCFLNPAPIRFFRWIQSETHPMANLNRVTTYLRSLRLGLYLTTGFRTFVGAAIWLFPPTLTLIVASQLEPGPAAILSLVGGLFLAYVAVMLPYLQTRVVTERRFAAMFERKAINNLFKKAPISYVLSFFILVLFSLPLYLLKIELTPREVAWLPSLLFVLFIFPARLLIGWTVYRAHREDPNDYWLMRWIGRAGLVPLGLAYTLILYLTQYLSWQGPWSLLEQHAFLVPAPLL